MRESAALRVHRKASDEASGPPPRERSRFPRPRDRGVRGGAERGHFSTLGAPERGDRETATGGPRRCGGVDEAACGARKKSRRAEPAASGRKVASVAEGTPPRARDPGSPVPS